MLHGWLKLSPRVIACVEHCSDSPPPNSLFVFPYIFHSQIEPRNQDIARKLRNAEVALAQSKKIDYYKILEVGRNAETIEIKKSYKRLALLWHPDKHAGGS